MANPNSKFKVKFTALLDEPTDKMLVELAEALQISKSHLCRTLIKGAYSMRHGQRPACADGTQCRCPHAHVYSPSLPQPAAAELDSNATR